MRGLSAVRTALEELAPEADAELLADGNMELEVVQAAQNLENHFDGVTTTNTSNDKMYQYGVATEQLIESGRCNDDTLRLLAIGMESHISMRQGFTPRIATEAFTDVNQAHAVALEGLRDIFLHDFQAAVVSFKHRKDFFADLFRSTNGKLDKYDGILSEAKSEYGAKHNNWKDSHHQAFMIELWYHFSTDKGEAGQRIMEIMQKDLAMSKYVLETYPTELLDLMKKLTGIVKSGKLTTIKTAVDLGKAVEKLEHPAEVFKKGLLGGKPYFGVTGLELKKMSSRTAVTLSDTTFQELAKLASPMKVYEDWSGMHTAKKIATNALPYGHLVAAVTAKRWEMTTAEIGKVIDNGFEYLNHVRRFAGYESRVINAGSDFISAMEKLIDTLDNKMSDREMAPIKQMVKQIEEVGTNILNCLQSPAAQEIARSLKTARYCGYLGKRMIWNAQ